LESLPGAFVANLLAKPVPPICFRLVSSVPQNGFVCSETRLLMGSLIRRASGKACFEPAAADPILKAAGRRFSAKRTVFLGRIGGVRTVKIACLAPLVALR
jgi:hypothetical protein